MGLSLLWAPYVRAGAIAGIALATLLHVTLAVAVVSAGYQLLELAGRSRVALAVVLAGGIGLSLAALVLALIDAT